jgi:hypothetical protein
VGRLRWGWVGGGGGGGGEAREGGRGNSEAQHEWARSGGPCTAAVHVPLDGDAKTPKEGSLPVLSASELSGRSWQRGNAASS